VADIGVIYYSAETGGEILATKIHPGHRNSTERAAKEPAEGNHYFLTGPELKPTSRRVVLISLLKGIRYMYLERQGQIWHQ